MVVMCIVGFSGGLKLLGHRNIYSLIAFIIILNILREIRTIKGEVTVRVVCLLSKKESVN